MQKICKKYAKIVEKIWLLTSFWSAFDRLCCTFKKFLKQILKKCGKNMQKICKKYAKNMQKICKKYAKNMQKICKKICKKYAKNMQKICKKYAKKMQKIWLLSFWWAFDRLCCTFKK